MTAYRNLTRYAQLDDVTPLALNQILVPNGAGSFVVKQLPSGTVEDTTGSQAKATAALASANAYTDATFSLQNPLNIALAVAL